jgi:cation diffusion facilitator family transporter
MKVLEKSNTAIARRFIENFDDPANHVVRIQCGLLAGWTSMILICALFLLRLSLGLISASIAVIADALNLLVYILNAAIVTASYWLSAHPATVRTPFGQGRMVYAAPLIMSAFLFFSGFQLGHESRHQIADPEAILYWSGLPWMLLFTIVFKSWVSQFVSFLGRRVNSHAILAIIVRDRIDSWVTFFVIVGLMAAHRLQRPDFDGYIGIVASVGLCYLGYHEGRKAIIPILGKAPEADLIRDIRQNAKMVEGIEDVHEIIVHDYGTMYLLTLHAEIHERHGPAEMHEIAERCEARLRALYGGEAVCHTDPLLERTPEGDLLEAKFQATLSRFPEISGYHDFRIVAQSNTLRIVLADLDVHEMVPEKDFGRITSALESEVKNALPDIAYCGFYITPKFAY